MKKQITFLLAILMAIPLFAQKEYRIIRQYGNKIEVSDDAVYQRFPMAETVINEVVETENVVKNVLVRDYQTINYYHEPIVKENHFYIGGRYKRYVNPRRVYLSRYSGYSQVEYGYEKVQHLDNEKWYFFFQYNSDYLTNKEELGHLIDYAKSNEYAVFYIDAYADAETGTKTYNLNISARRANAVINALINEGISSDRLFVKYHGCTNQPYRTNNLNRCVTVKSVFK